mgnify:CR=1 FL=1
MHGVDGFMYPNEMGLQWSILIVLYPYLTGLVAGAALALEKYGTMSFGDVAQAAIRFARDGFAMHWFMAEYLEEHQDSYRRWPSSAEVFLPNGKPPKVGDLFVQRDLGRTIQYMADQEKAQSAKGRVAERHQAGVADQHHQRDAADAVDEYPRRFARVIGRHHEGQREHDEAEQDVPAHVDPVAKDLDVLVVRGLENETHPGRLHFLATERAEQALRADPQHDQEHDVRHGVLEAFRQIGARVEFEDGIGHGDCRFCLKTVGDAGTVGRAGT